MKIINSDDLMRKAKDVTDYLGYTDRQVVLGRIKMAVNYCPEYHEVAVSYKRTSDGTYHCQVCGNEAYWDSEYGQQLFKYCPYCGTLTKSDEVTK